MTQAVFSDLSCPVTLVTLCELVPGLCDLMVWPGPRRMSVNFCEQGRVVRVLQ